MDEQNLELAFVKNVSYGYVDSRGVGMTIEVQILRGSAVMFIEASQATQLISDQQAPNVLEFKGRPCIVRVDENTITFVKMVEV